MKKNYNYNYVNRTTAQKSAVEFGNVEVASCKSATLKKSAISNGMVWHTTDTNEFYYDWNNKRTKLNVSGDSETITSEINKLKSDVAKLNPDTIEAKINNATSKAQNAVNRAEAAVSSVNNIKSEVNAAKAQADAAAQAAQDVVADVQAAVASVENKADKSYVDNAVAGAFDNLTAEQKAELKGETGAQGPKGDSFTYSDFTPEQLAALKGADGQNGTNGADGQDGENGKSAYEVAVANGYNGTVEAWLNSLKGADGQNGSNGADGQDGQDGKSAFELAQEAGFTGTKEEWLESLKGEPGEGLSQADRELIESLAELGESDFATGSFPTGANVDDQSADENGLATVQDVMDYVNAFFEKKKDELEPGEAKDYFYVNGVEYVDGTETLTSIYQMNCFEIGEEVDLSTYNVAYTGTGFALEVKINSEIYGFLGDGGVNDPTTIYSELFTVDVPNGYTLEVHQFDPISGGYAEAVQSMMSNPKGATKHYGSKTYNSYARYTTDLYGEGDDPMCVIASPARYLIIIKK